MKLPTWRMVTYVHMQLYLKTFTGAIADSINFAIDQLRDLVSRIHETSQEVARYTQDTQSITNQLAEASEHQAQEIAGSFTAMNEMAQSIDQGICQRF